jgi:hypothetical protein
MVLYERFDLKVLDPGFLNPVSHGTYIKLIFIYTYIYMYRFVYFIMSCVGDGR